MVINTHKYSEEHVLMDSFDSIIVAMVPLWSTARPPTQPSSRKGPRTNKITVEPSSILTQQVILEYLLSKSKSYFHRNGPQDVRGPGRKAPVAVTGIHDNRFRPQGIRGTGQYVSIHWLFCRSTTHWTASNISNLRPQDAYAPPGYPYGRPLPSLPATSIRKMPIPLRTTPISAFSNLRPQDVYAPPDYPYGRLLHSPFLNFGPEDAYAPPGYTYGRRPPLPSSISIRKSPTLPRATLTDNLPLPSSTSDYSVQ
ncbi:hypothetical protein OE88DRAFT_1641157 [Heliocybe sulcata]|uniref:Uncharacterized protein n=1 Tax=Heliocybe sulcata TaxID=5364 RepID=A0A5C3NJG7_9AGAM|nr:hypothetical protein OE88DRAFT_1641157 [Heliocybe sulcata]